MNKDIRLSVSFLDHPKTIKLERRLGFDGVKALLRLWFFAATNKPSGVLSNMDDEDIVIASQWKGGTLELLSILEETKWTERNDRGELVLHDWEEHQGYVFHAEERKERARTAAKIRWEKSKSGCVEHASSNANSMQRAMQNVRSSNAPSPVPVPAPEHNNGHSENVSLHDQSRSSLSSSPSEMEKPKNLSSSLFSLIPQEHHSQDLQNIISAALDERGEEFVRSNIAYTNRRKRENYVGYLCSAFDKDYAQKARQDEERNRAGREKALDKKAEEERARKEEAEKDQEARTAFFELPQPERDRYIDEALKGFSPGLRPKSRESPLALSVAISKFMESHIPAGE